MQDPPTAAGSALVWAGGKESLRFEWGPGKARANARKHGVIFDEALTVFGDTLSLTIPEPGSLVQERRFAQVWLPKTYEEGT